MRRAKMGLLLAAIVQLMFSFVPCESTEASEDDYEYGDVVGPASSPLKMGLSICGHKADSGPCKALHTRYHFDIQTRRCEMFNFGGCQGNENNFLTLEECQEKCVVSDFPEKRKRSKLKKGQPNYCLLENDPGVCRGLIPRYFYNRESQKCERFMYGGCLGNQNNFQSLKECQDTCEDTYPSANALQTEEAMHMLFSEADNSTPVVQQAPLTAAFQVENDSLLLSTADSSSPGVQQVPLSNELKRDDPTLLFSRVNESTPVVEQEPTPLPSLCTMRMDQGLCRAQEKRFFYNHSTGKCHPFSYSGCGGNENNFTTRKSCLRMCKKGFFQKKKGVMKLRRKRKRQRIKLIDDEIVIERI